MKKSVLLCMLALSCAFSRGSAQGVLTVDPASPADLVTQVNALFASCRGPCQVRIPAGSYTVAAGTIHMTTNRQSLVGAGRDQVTIFYAGTNFIDWRQRAFDFTPAGTISGFTVYCSNPSVECITAGSLISPHFESLNLYTTGIEPNAPAGATSQGFVFQNTINFMERWVMRDVNVGGFTRLIHFMAPAGGTDSFGYGQMDNVNLNVTAGAQGIAVDAGASPYHLTRMQVMYNIAGAGAGTEVLHVAGGLTGEGFAVTGENGGFPYTFAHVLCGGALQFEGGAQLFGDGVVVDCPAPVAGGVPRFFLRPGSGLSGDSATTSPNGILSNFGGAAGRTVSFWPTAAFSWSNPFTVAGWGYVTGDAGASAPIAIYDGRLSFCLATKPSGDRGLPVNTLTPTSCVDGAGDWLSRAYTATGELPPSNAPSAGLDFSGGGMRVSGHGVDRRTVAPFRLLGTSQGGEVSTTYQTCGGAGNVADCSFPGKITSASLSTATPAVGSTCTIAGFVTLVIDGVPRKLAFCAP